MLLFLPIYATQARRQLSACFLVVCYTLATLSVSRTILLYTGAFYVIMWTEHSFLDSLLYINNSFVSLNLYRFVR